MKKILFLIGNISHSGGTERVTSLICNALAKEESYEIHIMSLAKGQESFFPLDKSIQLNWMYDEKVSMKTHYLQTVWKIRQFIIHKKIETVILVDSILSLFSIPALIGLNVKHICWEHFNFKSNLGLKSRKIARIAAAKYCDVVITLTERDKIFWQENINKIYSDIFAIANPTPYAIAPQEISGVTKTQPNINNKTILAVGRLTHQKGFDLLIQAWDRICRDHSDWTLHIVGSGEEEDNLKHLASQLKITDRIIFTPATKDIKTHYLNSSFLCLSSRYEGFPMVLLEAFALGLPMIAFDCETGPDEIIQNNYNGFLVENGNILQLSEKLKEVIHMKENFYLDLQINCIESSKNFYATNIVHKWKTIL